LSRLRETLHILGELWLGETNPNNVVAVRLREKNPNKIYRNDAEGK